MLRLLLDNGLDIYTLDTERDAIMKQELIGNIAYAINYLQNKNGLLEEMSFTRC